MRSKMFKGLITIMLALSFLGASVNASAYYYNGRYYHRNWHTVGPRYHCWVVAGHRDGAGYWVPRHTVCAR